MSWKIDPSHSQVTFAVRHMMVSNVHGRFENFTGTVEFDEADPTRSSVDVQIDASSINTREEQRDGHLKSADFLNVAEYPYLTFKSKRIEKLDDSTANIIGDLTIRDVTHEATLHVEYAGQGRNPWGMTVAGFTAQTQINRKDWGLTWNVGLETGGVLVSDQVRITIELEMVKQAQPELEAVAA